MIKITKQMQSEGIFFKKIEDREGKPLAPSLH